MKAAVNHRESRLEMLRQKRKCFWCGVPMLRDFCWPLRTEDRDRVATIDHVYPKGHPLRPQRSNVVVLACWRCNQDRNEIATEFHKIKHKESLNGT